MRIDPLRRLRLVAPAVAAEKEALGAAFDQMAADDLSLWVGGVRDRQPHGVPEGRAS